MICLFLYLGRSSYVFMSFSEIMGGKPIPDRSLLGKIESVANLKVIVISGIDVD